jgi:hypothetical protein
MILDTKVTLEKGTYHAQIGLNPADDALSTAEKEALEQFGEPTIACGGVFGSGGTTFTLAANDLRFPSQFPVKHTFSIADDEQANDYALLFNSTLTTRITAGVAGKRGLSAGTTGRNSTTIATD